MEKEIKGDRQYGWFTLETIHDYAKWKTLNPEIKEIKPGMQYKWTYPEFIRPALLMETE